MTAGCDYAFGKPAFWASAAWMADLKKAGIKFAGRYVSTDPANDTNGKNLLPAEQKALHGAGISIILFAEEDSAQWMTGGYVTGVSVAKHFEAVCKSLGMADAIMFCAADFDTTPADQTEINACLDGVASVIGRNRTGIYGGFWTVTRALNAGKADFAAQTYAWSGATNQIPQPPHSVRVQIGKNWFWFDQRAHLWQGTTRVIAGVTVDSDTGNAADFGQWPRPVPSPPGVWGFTDLRELKLLGAGYTSVHIEITSPAGFTGTPPKPTPGLAYYEVAVLHNGSVTPGYPRHIAVTPGVITQQWQGGGLTRHTPYELEVRASTADGMHVSPWSKVSFTTA